MNLFLAVFWFLFGVGILLWERMTGEYVLGRLALGRSLLGGGVSVGWLMLALAVYNLVRWWMVRSYREAQRALKIEEMHRELLNRRTHHELPSEPDPNFDFTREPPPAERRVTDQPPPNP